jgi:anti-anti-sigma factor
MRVTCGPDPEMAGALLATAIGRLDALGSTQLWESLESRIAEQSPSLLLDMSGIKSMSSAGIGILIRLLTRCQQLGGSLAVFAVPDVVLRVVQVVQLEAILNVCADAPEARARLAQRLGR